MATVPENLEKILQARYGEEVRGAIYDSIRQCYIDGGDSMVQRPDLSDGTDLNTLTATGVYFVGTSITVENAPAKAGLLLVFADPGNSNTRNYQIFKSYNTEKVYFRYVEGGTFTDWTAFEYGTRSAKSGSGDLNSYIYTRDGVFFITADGSQSNVPYNIHDENIAGFILFVHNEMENDSIQRICQILVPYAQDGFKSAAQAAVRFRDETGWSVWRSLGFGDVADMSSATSVGELRKAGYYYFSSSASSSLEIPNSLKSNGGIITVKSSMNGEWSRFYYEANGWNLGKKIVAYRHDDDSFTPWYDITDTVSVVRNSSGLYKVYFGSFTFDFFNTNKSSTNSNNWNIGNIVNNNEEILVPSGTDIVGPVLILGDSDFVGGVHGDERVDEVFLYMNGENLMASEEARHIGQSATIIMKSKIYSEQSKTYSFDRYVTIYIEPNRLHIFNTYNAVRSLTLQRATLGGLIAARNEIIDGMMFDHQYQSGGATSNIDLGNNTKHATIFTKNGTMTLNNLGTMDPDTYHAFVTAFTNENPPRSKIYFDNFKQNSSGYHVSEGDLISGEFEYLFS